jgi:hypothetical protein
LQNNWAAINFTRITDLQIDGSKLIPIILLVLLTRVVPTPNWPTSTVGRLNQWIVMLSIWMNCVHESFAQSSKKSFVLQIIVTLAKVKISYFNIESAKNFVRAFI